MSHIYFPKLDDASAVVSADNLGNNNIITIANTTMKNIETIKKNVMRNAKLNNFTGIIEKIKIISFPSVPPIVVKENNVNDIINEMIKENNFRIMKIRTLCVETIFIALRIKLNRNMSLKRSFEIFRYFTSQYRLKRNKIAIDI